MWCIVWGWWIIIWFLIFYFWRKYILDIFVNKIFDWFLEVNYLYDSVYDFNFDVIYIYLEKKWFCLGLNLVGVFLCLNCVMCNINGFFDCIKYII